MRKNIGICISTNHTTILRDKAIACSHYMGHVLPHFTRKAKSSPKISYNIHFCIAILKFLCSWRMPRMHIWVWLKGTPFYIEWTTLSEIVWLEILVQKTLLQCATLVSCLDFPFGHSSHSAIADSIEYRLYGVRPLVYQLNRRYTPYFIPTYIWRLRKYTRYVQERCFLLLRNRAD